MNGTRAQDLATDFAAARVTWRQARERLAKRDTPLDREARDEALMDLDTILDMYLELDCE